MDHFEQPAKSPYIGFGNNPVVFVDPDGGVIRFYDRIYKEEGIEYVPGEDYMGESNSMLRIVKVMNQLYQTNVGRVVIDHLVNSERSFEISNDRPELDNAGAYVKVFPRGESDEPAGGRMVLADLADWELLPDLQAANLLSEELYHLFQTEFYHMKREAYIEVEAKLFAQRMSEALVELGIYSTTPARYGPSAVTSENRLHERAFSLMVEELSGGTWDQNLFNVLVSTFKHSDENTYGTYDEFGTTSFESPKLAEFFGRFELIKSLNVAFDFLRDNILSTFESSSNGGSGSSSSPTSDLPGHPNNPDTYK